MSFIERKCNKNVLKTPKTQVDFKGLKFLWLQIWVKNIFLTLQHNRIRQWKKGVCLSSWVWSQQEQTECVLPSAYSCRPHVHVSPLSSHTSVRNLVAQMQNSQRVWLIRLKQCRSREPKAELKRADGVTAVILHAFWSICAETLRAEVTHFHVFLILGNGWKQRELWLWASMSGE